MQTKTLERMDLRREILKRARHMLLKEGYARLSMRKIASQAGVTATAIYLHFSNKDDLLHALMEEGFELHYEALKERMSETRDAAGNMEALCRAHIAFGLKNPEYFQIMFLMDPGAIERYPVEKYRRATRNIILFQAVIQEGIQEGVFRQTDPILASHTVWATLHGAVSLILANRMHISFNREDLVEESIQSVRRYLFINP